MDVARIVRAFWSGRLTHDFQDVVDSILERDYESKKLTSPYDIKLNDLKTEVSALPNFPTDGLTLRLILARSPWFVREYGVAIHVKVIGDFNVRRMEVSYK